MLLCVTGLIALLVWQSLFPSARDYPALASLPVRAGQVFTARFTSATLSAAAIGIAMNILPSLIAPVEFGGEWRLDASYVRDAAAQAEASGLAPSPDAVRLRSGSCTSAGRLAPRFFQTPPHDALALR